MKTVNARDLQKKIKECVDMSQQDQVVITRRGKPAAVMVGVEGKDWEDVVLQTSCRVPPNSEHWISESRLANNVLGNQPGGQDGQTESLDGGEALPDRERST